MCDKLEIPNLGCEPRGRCHLFARKRTPPNAVLRRRARAAHPTKLANKSIVSRGRGTKLKRSGTRHLKPSERKQVEEEDAGELSSEKSFREKLRLRYKVHPHLTQYVID